MLLKKLNKILNFFPQEYQRIIKLVFLLYFIGFFLGYFLAYIKLPQIEFLRNTFDSQIYNDSFLNFVFDKIQKRNFIEAIIFTFAYNFFVGALLTTTFSGFLFFMPPIIGFARAFFIGFVFSGKFSFSLFYLGVLIVTMILEFVAYILSTSYGFSLGLSLIWPSYFKKKTVKESFLKVLKDFYYFYLPIFILLFLGAVWEIFGIIFLMGGF